MARDYIWFLTHNGNYHNENIYLKYEYDQKNLSEQETETDERDSTDGIVVHNDSSQKDLDSSGGEDELCDDDIANLCLNEKKSPFYRYELADLVIKKEFEQKNFEYAPY